MTLPLDDALAHYAEHGWARLGRVLSDEGIASLTARADDLMMGRLTYPGMFFQHDSASGRYEDLDFGRGYEGPSVHYRKIEKLEKDPLFLTWIENPVFERIARASIEGDVVIYRAVLFTKAANAGSPIPFHQDAGSFWGLSADPELQIWTGLDDASEEAGCLEVVSGSHKNGLASPLGGVVAPLQIERARAHQTKTLVPTRAGEALLIHNHLWHGSGTNRTAAPRRALTICYMSASTRCLRKKRTPRVFPPVFRR
jgi:phytanoyl-CoA hydroxylase